MAQLHSSDTADDSMLRAVMKPLLHVLEVGKRSRVLCQAICL